MIKRTFLWLLVVLGVVCAGAPTAWAAIPEEPLETLEKALPSETQKLLSDVDPLSGNSWSDGMTAILSAGRERTEMLLRQVIGSGAALLVIVMLCNGARLLYGGEQDARVLRCTVMTGALAITVLSAGNVDEMIGLGAETIHIMDDFSKTLLPLLGMACAASGGAAAAAVREMITTLFVDFLVTFIDRFLVPLVYIYIGAIAAHAVLQHHSLQAIAKGIRKAVVWSLTGVVAVFTGYLAVSGVISGTADAAALRAAKFAISGAVPVVGSVLSEAASTLLLGASAMKNAIGLFGTLAIFAVCMLPFLQIGMQYLLYKVTAFFAELFDQAGLAPFISDIGGAFGLILGMAGACALLLLISLIVSISVVVPL